MQVGHLFWCERTDRFERVKDLRDASLVQMAVTRDVSFDNLEDVNGWFAEHWPSCQDAGVHGLVIMTHAMFMRGVPDPFRSLHGGGFDVLDQHLAWVRENYPFVEFVTATEAVLDFLDYYTPELRAVVDPRLIGGDPASGRFEFSVRLLGSGIFVGPDNPAVVSLIAPPIFEPSDVRQMVVRIGTSVVAVSRTHKIEVTLTDRSSQVTIEITVSESAVEKMGEILWAAGEQAFHEVPEKPMPDLLTLRQPVDGNYTSDLLRILTNPIAGRKCEAGAASIASVVLSGACVAQALKAGAVMAPRWMAVDFDAAAEFRQDFSVTTSGGGSMVESIARDGSGRVMATAKVGFENRERSPRSLWKLLLKRLKIK